MDNNCEKAMVCPNESKKLIKSLSNVKDSPMKRMDKSKRRSRIKEPHKISLRDKCKLFWYKFSEEHPIISCLYLYLAVLLALSIPFNFYHTLKAYDASNSIMTDKVPINKKSQQAYVETDKQQCNIQAEYIPSCVNQVYGDSCILKECCWLRMGNKQKLGSQCFFSMKNDTYKYINISATDEGAVAYLKIIRNSTYPKNVQLLKVNFNYWTGNMLEIKIYDPLQKRFEPPFPSLPPLGPKAAKNTNYVVNLDKDKNGFQVVRKSNNKTVFDTQDMGEFIFSDQFIRLSSKLPSSKIYGLGQQRNRFMLDMNWTQITLFNHDQQPKDKSNLYGTHPFYLAMEDEGSSSGVLLLNSNAMDIILSPLPSITYQTIGGVLDFFIFLGPSPADVLQQYTGLVGRPSLPPYWSLGFHLCRFGYKSLNETVKVWNRTRAAKIPFDTQWNDLDYMESSNDFTYDKIRFKGLPEFVDLLHKEGMHYMVLVDPGISAGELPGKYPPLDQGIAQEIFVMDSEGVMPFVGKVWNKKETVFVDFFKPAAVTYWMDQLQSMHKLFAFDGAWIDMNDPSNFLDGTKSGCPNTSLDNPPYLPAVAGEKLYFRTLCMSAQHDQHQSHYNLHNVYGLAEALVTNFAMQQIRAKRAFVISRSSFPGTGHYAGVWSGDISSTWDDMVHSVSDMLSFSLFGIPMFGADICGFSGNASAALCQRWSQLGAFYPFSRNHNSDESSDQDPVSLGPAVVEAARSALLIRYSLLPYLYTLFWHAHTNGDTVARPMFVEFPHDNQTHTLNSQFMWGGSLLVVPVLQEGATNVTAYIPEGTWYNFHTYQSIKSSGSHVVLAAPLDTIPLLLREGCVIPTQRPELTTTQSRTNPVDLLVAMGQSGEASGDLYWDDGETLDYDDGIYNMLNFSVRGNVLNVKVLQWRYTAASLVLGNIRFLGIDAVSGVTISGKETPFTFIRDSKMLLIENLYLDLKDNYEVKWI